MIFPGELLGESIVSEWRRYLHILALSYALEDKSARGRRTRISLSADLSGTKQQFSCASF